MVDERTPNIVILDELRDLVPHMTEQEYSDLKVDILKNGCINPILLWHRDDGTDVVIDGHNRYRVCSENEIPFSVVYIQCEDIEDAMIRTIDAQMSRRNISTFTRIELASKKRDILSERARKRMLGGIRIVSTDEGNEPAKSFDEPSTESYVSEESSMEADEANDSSIELKTPALFPERTKQEKNREHVKNRTQSIIGSELGISGESVRKAQQILENAEAEIIDSCRKDKLSISTAYDIARLPKDKQVTIVEKIASGKDQKEINKVVKELKQSISSASKTEKNKLNRLPYFESAINVMDHADFDPSGYDIEDASGLNGIKEDFGAENHWVGMGNVFLDLSFRPEKALIYANEYQYFCDNMDTDEDQMIYATSCTPWTAWFQDALKSSDCICFVNSDDNPGAKHAVFYAGKNKDSFLAEFSKYGYCIKL